MAIGVRITSNNLSGQTANVTFLPTSGGTIDLGTQTIPFNYINSSPYGTFQVYVPLYNYTYDITINEPIDVKSFVFSSKLINNNNHGFVNLNYGDLTATIFDLGVDYTGWYLNDIYPLTESGYGFYFGNNNTCDLQWVIFTDSVGNVIDNFQTNCNCNYSYDNLGGKFTTFADYYNSILKIFDGKNVYTFTADSTTELVDYIQDWDGVTSGNTMIVKFESKTGSTFNLNIFKNGSLISFGETYDYNTEDIRVRTYFDGSFIYVTKYDIVNSKFSYIKIYDGQNGELLQNEDISSFNFNDNSFSFYGKNKCVQIFWNNGDPNIDYFIYQYDGNTNTSNTLNHDRFNYQNYPNSYSNQNLYPNNGGSDSFAISLYSPPYSYNNVGVTIDYCDIIYMLSEDTTIQTLVFQSDGTPTKTLSGLYVNNNIFANCDNGNGYISVLSITNTGVTYHNTNLLLSNGAGQNDSRTCGNGFAGSFYENNSYDLFSIIHITENGTLGDLINGIQLPGAFQRDSESLGSLYHFRPYTGNTYYITPSSDLFQIGTVTGNTFSSYYAADSFVPDFIRTGNILYFNYVSYESYVLTPTGLTSTFTLPSNNGNYGISVGDNYFVYAYVDDISGVTHINLYDFNFNVVNSLITEFTNVWTTDACKDNFMVTINENSKYYIYLVTNSQITYKELSDNNSYYTYNDYVWWD